MIEWSISLSVIHPEERKFWTKRKWISLPISSIGGVASKYCIYISSSSLSTAPSDLTWESRIPCWNQYPFSPPCTKSTQKSPDYEDPSYLSAKTLSSKHCHCQLCLVYRHGFYHSLAALHLLYRGRFPISHLSVVCLFCMKSVQINRRVLQTPQSIWIKRCFGISS